MSDIPDGPADATVDDAWPAPLDALVAAPMHHTLLFENDRVRVLETRIRPGEQTPVHTHRWPAAQYIFSWSAFIRYDPAGNVLVDSRLVPRLQNPPTVSWAAPLPPHSLRNVGETDLHGISVEIKG